MTIKDIAKESGYAVGTVSRVLNNHPDVSTKARERIMAVVEKHGFVPNNNARQLKQTESRTIVILVKGTSNILLNSLLERIQKRIEKSPYTSSVAVLDEYDNEAWQASRLYYERRPIGMIFLGGNPQRYEEDFNKIKVPCVLISNQADNVQNNYLSSVGTDDMPAAEYANDYLISNGHRKIGVIGGNIDNSEITLRRYNGFCESMKKAGLSFDFDSQYVTTKYSFEGGAEAAKELLAKYPDLTAIYTMSDAMAIGACRQLRDMGYSIPGDISIVGFDGLPITEYYHPRLTTIRQSADNLADSGLEILLNCIERDAAPVHKVIPFEFIKGESVKNIN